MLLEVENGTSLFERRDYTFRFRRSCSEGFEHEHCTFHRSISPKDLQVLEQVGEGGFAVVKRCELHVPGKTSEIVAAKQLKPDSFRRDREFLDFVSEMLLMSRLCHPHIVQFVGLVEGDLSSKNGITDNFSVVEEYMNMGSLRDQLVGVMSGNNPPYARSSGMRWMLQVAKGLRYLHGLSATVIHRDLKPENILFTKDRFTGNVVVKIADFGLSAVIARHNRSVSTDSQDLESYRSSAKYGGIDGRRYLKSELERVHQRNAGRILKYGSYTGVGNSNNIMRSASLLLSVLDPRNYKPKDVPPPVKSDIFHDLSGRTGSSMYMAPEVLSNKRYNEKVDVYSFGIILYEVMARCKLLNLFLSHGTPPEIAAKRIKQYSESVLNGYRPSIPMHWPIGVRTLIQDCWQHDPRDRPTVDEIVSRLTKALKIQVAKEQREEDARLAECNCCQIM